MSLQEQLSVHDHDGKPMFKSCLAQSANVGKGGVDSDLPDDTSLTKCSPACESSATLVDAIQQLSSFEDRIGYAPFMHPVGPSFFVLEGLGCCFHRKLFDGFPHHSQERLGYEIHAYIHTKNEHTTTPRHQEQECHRHCHRRRH